MLQLAFKTFGHDLHICSIKLALKVSKTRRDRAMTSSIMIRFEGLSITVS